MHEETRRIRGISLALVFKKIDDLSVTNSMEENYQKPGAEYSSGGNLNAKQ